ncbi:MAG: hypothetical protein P8J45_05600 [Phycisphaerales bacterium]|jgi:hypothetical protein|nr:hypothetical protein [Phycisphaerales bacterium]
MLTLVTSLVWVLLVLLAVVVCFLLLRRSRSTVSSCPGCGYDIEGLTEPRCVECGRSLERGVVPIGGITRRRRLGLVGVILLLTGILIYPPLQWGSQTMFALARWRALNASEVDIKIDSVLVNDTGERFSASFRGVDFLEQDDIIRITFRIEEPGQEPIIWEQAEVGTWNNPVGLPLEGDPIVEDLIARLDGEPRGMITRALLESPDDFAQFLSAIAANPEQAMTRVMVPGRADPLLICDSSTFSDNGSRVVRSLPSSIPAIPGRIALGLVFMALVSIGWILLRPGLVAFDSVSARTAD